MPEAPSAKQVSGFTYDGVRAGRKLRAGLSRRAACTRPLPLEDVVFFIKNIDNYAVEYRYDPTDKRSLRRLVGCGLAVALTLLLAFGPRAWVRQSGYRTAELSRQIEELRIVQDHLTVRQGQLADLRRVADLAAKDGFVEPRPGDYAWQDRTVPPVNPDNALAQLIAEGN
jgi:hypothetical protein